ncbi:hypothetical protein H2198_010431 [Neophaeococcomyces mojaviensis]|uniref:Uncharacterized protein n=1 Tax=Neophaeococcomyces mojaviensis TaxID=3383035 RepID=A0ACC2ZRN8_9EURO|nr:hypothetical protein H2198_010431 [Knufia sp. JES_112]
MSAHSYNLRSRVNSPASLRTPATTPTSKLLLQAHRKPYQSPISVQLDHVIGTTAKIPSGLSSCNETSSFAYCAGSVAVLSQIDDAGTLSNRYYRARPAAIPLNLSSSYYSTPTSTPTKKRTGTVTPRRELESNTPSRALLADENAKTWTARERIKSVKCVSLSSDGRLLAVGETGYNPRVLLFSTSRDASTETPLSIITDHTWGVRGVAFSPDSRFLATLGESNDGFLFVWSVNSKTGSLKLCATNKCTTNICHMTWCGQHLLTVGTRHVKVWQLPDYGKGSPSKRPRLRNLVEHPSGAGPVPLSGRNCLLGELGDVTFTCIVPISEQQALLCTDIGSLCIVDVSKTPAQMTLVNHELCPAGAMGFREGPQRLVWAGGGGDMQETELDTLLRQKEPQSGQIRADLACIDAGSRVPRRPTLRQSLGLSQLSQSGTIAIACLTKHTVCIDTDSNLFLTESGSAHPSVTSKSLSSHNEPVQGVQTLDASPELGAFFTWSKNGEVRFWDANAGLQRAERIELDDGSDIEDIGSNELKVLRYCGHGLFLSGDHFGVIKLTRCDAWQLLHTARAHSAEVNDICVDHASAFVATCSRDRMVQVFELRSTTLDLLQTTDDHIAAVNQVVFNHDGGILLSCSVDRTIVVREKACRDVNGEMLVAFLSTRIITIKASPVSMCLVPGEEDALFVSTLDRHVTKVDFMTGMIVESFKITDPDTDDTAVLNVIQVATNIELGSLRRLLIGVSSTDKSARVYDLDKKALLAKESAHTEGVSDLALIGTGPDRRNLTFVSTGLDSTIMIWTVIPNNHLATTLAIELTQEQVSSNDDSDNVPAKASPATMPPLRKVLTKLDIVEFVKSHSPRTPTREPSPARLKRKPSKLAIASSAVQESNENVSPALKRRASADDRTKTEQRSPSPPAYATRRTKKPSTRGEVTKDFFTRQSEWLRRSPSPQNTPNGPVANLKQDTRANKSKLRRPPSVPTDLRAKALEQRRSSTAVPTLSDSVSINLATEHTSRILKTYRKKLQTMKGDINLVDLEEELEGTLKDIRKLKDTKKSEATDLGQRPELTQSQTQTKRQMSSSRESPGGTKGSNSTMSTEMASPPAVWSHEPVQSDSAKIGLGVDGLSVLLEKTNLS